MEVDVLIIGQGICGTMLSWYLQKEGKSFCVIDETGPSAASRVAAGIINPVTGRRYHTTWMAEELLSFALPAYKELGDYLETPLIYPYSVIDFFPTAQMRNTFVDRISENDTYLHSYPEQNTFNSHFNYDFGCGEIKPSFTVDMQSLLPAWRNELLAKNRLLDETFVLENLKVGDDGVHYGPMSAKKIVFCDGMASAANPWFSLLPFSGSKGEALIIACEGLNREHIFKKGMLLVPLPEAPLFWLGSNYQWEFENDQPSAAFFKSTTDLLNHWLKKPFEILEHKAGVRPSTLERRPFVGFHPQDTSVGILNGMGTKGVSLAPFFAHQLVQHMVHNFPITPEADVHRFQRILTK
ncbi:FAD-binding oxidoreductase [Flavisolibacter sp. BT320]|nr:FAD-binding oxidoreductase [Flavisolibacter longurius]